MNKKVAAIITAVLVIAVGAYGIYRVVKHFKRLSGTPVAQTATTESPTSLRDLIAKGISQSCTYSTDKSTGTIYLSGGKIRGDFNMTIDDKVSASHMIIMDNTNYLWTEGSKTGIKMAFDQTATPAPVTSNTPTNTFDANALNNYKCSAWISDSAMFTLPTGITFSSFNLPSATTKTSGGTAPSQCSYCDSLTGDSKTQCLTALKCN
jgi:hypothetical protein